MKLYVLTLSTSTNKYGGLVAYTEVESVYEDKEDAISSLLMSGYVQEDSETFSKTKDGFTYQYKMVEKNLRQSLSNRFQS